MPSGWKIRVADELVERHARHLLDQDRRRSRSTLRTASARPAETPAACRRRARPLRAASSAAPARRTPAPAAAPIGAVSPSVSGVAAGSRRQRQARGVREDVAHGHRPRRLAAAGQRVEHLLVRVRRQPLRDRIVEQELAVFPQHHQRRGHDRLGHRREGEDRVLLHRLVLFLVAPALRLEVDDLALARDQRHRAGNLVGVDVVLDEGVDALEPLRRHADRLGLRERQVGLRATCVTRPATEHAASDNNEANLIRLLVT